MLIILIYTKVEVKQLSGLSEISAVFMHKYYSIVTDRISPQANIGCLFYIMFNLKHFKTWILSCPFYVMPKSKDLDAVSFKLYSN